MDTLKKEFESIYSRYYHTVYAFCVKLCSYDKNLAEELTQNTFCKAITAADSFRGDCGVKTWLCQIARNDYISYLRKEKHLVKSDDFDQVLRNIPDPSESVQERLEETESVRHIYEILDNLESPYGEVFRMRVVQELGYSEIAAHFQKTENWARVIYYRAKQKIISIMEQEGEDE